MTTTCRTLRGRLRRICEDRDPTCDAAERRKLIERLLELQLIERDPDADAPPQVPAAPSLISQATSFAKAAVKHVANGAKNVSEEQLAARIAICGACPSFDAEKARCRECGCKMQVKAKWEVSECPLGKWPTASESSPSHPPASLEPHPHPDR